MKVLVILGLIVIGIIIYVIIEKMNDSTYREFKYKFFDSTSYFLITVGYLGLYFGNSWYQTALNTNADTLNGIIIIVIGIILLLAQIYLNFKSTNIIYGIFGTLFQFIIFIPLSLIGIFIFIVVLMIASNTKPVYQIN